MPDLSRASDYKAARIRPWTSTTQHDPLLGLIGVRLRCPAGIADHVGTGARRLPDRRCRGATAGPRPALARPSAGRQPALHCDAILTQHAAMAAAIDRHLARLETERVCDYRPSFWPGDARPVHATIRRWASGFAAAMALVPDA